MKRRIIVSIIVFIIVLIMSFVYIKSVANLQNEKQQVQEELVNMEKLLQDANNELKATQELLNNQIQQNESLVAEIDALKLEFEALQAENEEYKSLISFVDLDAPDGQRMKSYMYYQSITTKTSPKYRMQHTVAYTGEYGLRMVNGRYCVALGSYYTSTIGQYVDIELANGKIIQGILADQKSDAHTDAMHQIHFDGSVVEFVMDGTVFDPAMLNHSGDVSRLNGWDSDVVNIRVYNIVEDFG